MNILFWVRKNYITRKGTAQIICTISIEGKKIDIGTPLSIEPKNWKQSKQKAFGENSNFINEAISKIRNSLIEIKPKFEAQSKNYTLQDIKNTFLGKNTRIETKQPTITICQALEKVQEIRANHNASTTNFRDKSYFQKFKHFLEKNNLLYQPAESINKTNILAYLDEIKAKNNSTTYNNYFSWLKAVFIVRSCLGLKKISNESCIFRC
ncbi:Arm DNA-binding domain-containing protein [Raineya orbicola]|uniref:Arm DNA-binding domain-containing protein n=1 Tax=Raineya orbicola TaxID=2016530 RepID=A0A2N3I723_9BACT|nr:Arm DNA-binding domain-containing protein [Raineya orbicola]PKQ66043.1 hypothetical protein Rain11_2472 [Raineya orbicola]